MAQIVQAMLTTFYVLWLIAVLAFLWVIWRDGSKRTQKLEQALTDSMLTTAQAARVASEAAYILAQRQSGEDTADHAISH